jgi:DNA polymerase-3 subunit delta'
MPIPPLYGHEGLRGRLAAAIAAGRLPQVLLFAGPQGVGKQRLALWVAEALLCQGPSAGQPCGTCQGCRLVRSLSHPDLHWFVPIEPPKRAGDADKQVELVEEALGEVVAARRETPWYEPPSGLASHPIAAMRLLARRLALRPALGSCTVFVLGDADRLAPQPGQEAAANALLKALEEPPRSAFLILTTAAPEALPPTILSRVVQVRVAPLSDSVVAAFAQQELGITSQRQLAQLVASAQGCIGRLLAREKGEGDAAARAERFLAAARGDRAARYAFALGQVPFQARGAFTALLDELLQRLRVQARTGRPSAALVDAIARVLEARREAQGNVNPQLLAAVLADEWPEGA